MESDTAISVRAICAIYTCRLRWLRALGATFLLCIVGSTAQAARFDFDATPGRLSKDVVPAHYKLEFDLDPTQDTFAGHAEIDLTVRRPVSAIVLQATELTAVSVTLASASGATRQITVTPDKENHLWRLSWSSRELLVPGKWRLRIEYQGKVERRGQGLFRVEYRTGTQGETSSRMLATQFEPTHARAVFPAFDEPAFRATFDIAITAPALFEAVSNMPVSAQRLLQDGRRRTEFARTPSMPTYLVALSVGEFDALTDSLDGVPLRILTARGRSHEARYAMDVTKLVLGYFRDYFGIPYMLPKLDQFAIPGVRRGAMEDWGAISYNENLLLFDPKRSAPRQQQTIFNLVAHEIAHQWFGNLVTAAWWDDIWLNEAFATWMAAKAQQHFNPAWGVRVRERLYREEALVLDAGKATRAVADPPPHETAIFDVFDDITYAKGSAVLGMFEAQLGESLFRDGLRSYIATHRYSNATADDLWFHLSQAAGQDISLIIGSWIRQRGFPLLTVSAVCAGNRTRVELSQQRFTSQSTRELVAMWQVPVVINAGPHSKRLILSREPMQIEFPGCLPVVANGGDTGYYRVQYAAANMARLRAAYLQLPATERIGLVADTMALASSGRIGFAEYFRLLDAIRNDRDGAVWEQVIEGLTYLDDVFAGTPTQAAVRSYGRSLLLPVLGRLGWRPREGDDAGTMRIRNALIDTLGRFDDPETNQRASALFAGSVARVAVPIDPSIRSAVVRTAARSADPVTFETLRRLLRDATNQEDNFLFGGALILVRDPRLVHRILELALTDEWPPGSASWYLRNVGAASGHPMLARDFILQNFDQVLGKASSRGRMWVLPEAYRGFNELRQADHLLVVQRRLLGENAMTPAEQVSESIRDKAAVRERGERSLPALLEALTNRRPIAEKRLATVTK
jgi:aminopeptidase N